MARFLGTSRNVLNFWVRLTSPLNEKKAYFIFLSFVVFLLLILAEADTFKGRNGDQSQALTAQERRGGGRDRIQASHPEVDTNNVVDPNHTDSTNT
jgi:hypothetical protein